MNKREERLGARLAGRRGASWWLLGRSGGKSSRPGGIVGASTGVWGASWERLGAVLTRVGSEAPNPRQGSQIGAVEESKRESGLGGESRILDRGRSFEPLEGMKTKLEEAKRPNRR